MGKGGVGICVELMEADREAASRRFVVDRVKRHREAGVVS